ncbi:DUF2938 domain-containing protein [Shewanella sp. VB17]|uniref:DUF2938 domain-containing protein n=1 Tax=Shewanella sp. VB17 TaxID=2739432 RepID=UPI001565589C|nr:DUF2938 domain-containing protein [Shewanella sp. VB17]NRD72427.1 DUF2938 domain-containing protein [Shewanella sp. VB17]
MSVSVEFIIAAILLGCGATLVMDLWAMFLLRRFKIPSLNYAMVGRWVGHFFQGQFVHVNIGQAFAITGEKILGWIVHYLIGIFFSAILLGIWGIEWLQAPSLLPAILMGLITVLAPFLILQPGMGAGIAASKTPEPNVARLRSLGAHLSFGIGLYLSGIALMFVNRILG